MTMYSRVLFIVLFLLTGCNPKETSDSLNSSTPEAGTGDGGIDASLDAGSPGDGGTESSDEDDAGGTAGSTATIDINVTHRGDGGVLDGGALDAGPSAGDASVPGTLDAGAVDGGSSSSSGATSSVSTSSVGTSGDGTTKGDSSSVGSTSVSTTSADGSGTGTQPDAGEQTADGGEVTPDAGLDPIVLPLAPDNTASAVGDPHILTYDGLAYDMQGVGEFTATLDPSDGFEVQIRTAALNGTNVAINTAVAMRVGENRLGFYRDGATRLNGQDVEFTRGENPLTGGGSVWVDGDAVTVIWPDNSQVQFARRSTFISVYAHAALGHAGELVGLFGDFDGETEDELATRTGTTFESPTDFATFYGVFVESWRVTAATSLFDYVEGEGTETFTDRSFPSALATIADLESEVSDNAETVCTSAGVAEEWLEACTLDFGLTGDEDYVSDLSQTPVPSAFFVVEQVIDLCSIPADRVCDDQDVYVVDGCSEERTLQETCSGDATCSGGFCLTPQSAALRGLVKDAATEEPVASVLVVVKQAGVPVLALVTGNTGLYAAELAPGAYELVFSREGYLETSLLVELEPGHATTVTALRQVKVPEEEDATGDISGFIVDSVDGEGVPGVVLTVRPGINVTQGEGVDTTETDSTGAYAFTDLPPGNYTIAASAAGYLDAAFDVVVVGGEAIGDQNASITPSVLEGQLRIILTWGAEPLDLDSYLITPAIDGVSYQVYYSQKGSTDVAPYSALDLDDQESFGPETITIAQRFPGTYVYAVNNYSEAPAITGSSATVAVYTDAGLVRTYVVPTSGEGLWWTVFQLDGETGEITTIDAIGSGVITPPGDDTDSTDDTGTSPTIDTTSETFGDAG